MKDHNTFAIPADVPASLHNEFIKNYAALTKNTQRIFLFACDQKLEHMSVDYYGDGVAPEALDPEHVFAIANAGYVGALATHVGLITHYGPAYPAINYVAKLNGKTNLVPTQEHDPQSALMHTVEQVITLKKETNLAIRAIGVTVYLGSEYEAIMLEQAATAIWQAHQHGLVTFLWAYPRGKNIKKYDPQQLLIGAAGAGLSLGVDIVKIHMTQELSQEEQLTALDLAVQSAGTTKVIVAGGSIRPVDELIETVHHQLHAAHTAGVAIGRNIFTHSPDKAIALTQAISALVYKDCSIEEAMKLIR
jgi:fructose-bisphosphate aldolase / 6-deoxy-5-ketofructose 1-phosphate synthase